MSGLIDLMGRRFGRLVVVARAIANPRYTNRPRWACECDCGVTTTVYGYNLRRGSSRSCGCFQRDGVRERRETHGASKTGDRWPEIDIYHAMISRCYSQKCEGFKYYGARGISVCDRWRFGEGDQSGFLCFVADMGRRPHPDLTLERKDNDAGYSPDNCKWATAKEQSANRRYAHNSHFVMFRGQPTPATKVARALGMRPETLISRLRQGWSDQDATSRPVQARRK